MTCPYRPTNGKPGTALLPGDHRRLPLKHEVGSTAVRPRIAFAESGATSRRSSEPPSLLTVDQGIHSVDQNSLRTDYFQLIMGRPSIGGFQPAAASDNAPNESEVGKAVGGLYFQSIGVLLVTHRAPGASMRASFGKAIGGLTSRALDSSFRSSTLGLPSATIVDRKVKREANPGAL
jgi:hypothetical protein